jgi:DNA-binding LacI/PurR family transcriptional regulator
MRGIRRNPGHSRMTDVAARAGVSLATVSRALRGSPEVSAETRSRVLEAATSLSYVVSPAASRLASGRTATVGVVVPFITRWFFAEVVAGLEKGLHQAGMDVLLYNLGDADGRSRFFDRMPLRRRVDAVVILSLALDGCELDLVTGLGVPVVCVGMQVPGCSSVGIDDIDAARRAVRHLIELGHERIGMLRGAVEPNLGFTVPLDRHEGYLAAMAEAGLDTAGLTASTPWGPDGGAHAMTELLALPQPPTAVFAESDEMAIGALRTLRRAGLRVPEQMSVIGFDDHDMADLLDLTTVWQGVHQQGATAAEMVLSGLAHPDAPPRRVLLPTRLIVRQTTAPPRISARPSLNVPA